VVRLYSRQESAQALAEKFGVSWPTPYAWKTQILGLEAPAMMKRKKSALPPELEGLERQREALQRDIRELQNEHDLLKTASEMNKGSWRRSAEPEQSGKDHAHCSSKKPV
jgi:hypothetical protein